MQQYQFPQGFLWGAAASGPQTEGVTNKRHRSIWDSWFAEQPERFYQQVGPQTVCDTYLLPALSVTGIRSCSPCSSVCGKATACGAPPLTTNEFCLPPHLPLKVTLSRN